VLRWHLGRGGSTTLPDPADPGKLSAAERLRFAWRVHTSSRDTGGVRMDKLSADGTARKSVLARRRQLRAHARDRRNATGADADGFQTPEWLERSFVLPHSDRGATVVPSQSHPHHDDVATLAERPAPSAEVVPAAAPAFVRPPSQEIDFPRMIRRSDHCRMASRATIASIGFAGLGLIVFLLAREPMALVVAICLAVLAVIAAGVRVRLVTAPVPVLER